MPTTAVAPYAALKASQHQIASIRPSMLLAPDSPRPSRSAAAGPAAALTEVAGHWAARPRRDGTGRLGAIVPVDTNNRVFAKKLLDALGWDADTELVAEVAGHTAVVRRGTPTRRAPWLLVTRVDKSARLRLPSGAKGALQIQPGDQLLACAIAAAGELHLVAASDALQALTGEIRPEEPTVDKLPGESAARRTRVRAAATFVN